jgi:hypothetical protein
LPLLLVLAAFLVLGGFLLDIHLYLVTEDWVYDLNAVYG